MLDREFWTGRRVLVTGHTGFKGSWLLLLLNQLGAEVWGYALEPVSNNELFAVLSCETGFSRTFSHNIGDLGEREKLERIVQYSQPEVVIHLAAQALVRRAYQDPIGTWNTNLNGSLHVLEALRAIDHRCAVVMVTTDKVYRNMEWTYGYRELDRLGGHDPYSASKAAAELAIDSWRQSFCGIKANQNPYLCIATARAGNVIGGGDWAEDRIVPDAVRALVDGKPIPIRNPEATRPWQHVLEPLCGYLKLSESLACNMQPPCEPFNFGPSLSSNKPVSELVNTMLNYWEGTWVDQSETDAPHEATLLHLQIDKAVQRLDWKPQWDYETTVERTVNWYLKYHKGSSAMSCCNSDLSAYLETV